MRIFLSHSSKQKLLVREVCKAFQPLISTWLDEKNLLLGDGISNTLESAIRSEADYLLLFLDEAAAQSAWVKQELRWAAAKESTMGRVFVLVIVIDESALSAIPPEIASRNYLKLSDFSDNSIRILGMSLSNQLFALVWNELQQLKNTSRDIVANAENIAESRIESRANLIQKVVFNHRKLNPISVKKLCNDINLLSSDSIEFNDCETILKKILQRRLVPGLVYNGHELYLEEEHIKRKREINRESKVEVAISVAALIKNDMTVFLDAGSTTEEIIKILCRRITAHDLTNISIATTSVTHADLVSKCCEEMGFDDRISAVSLFVLGGQVRLGTQAIIPLPKMDQQQISSVSQYLGGFDIGIIGVNGIDGAGGFTTHENSEALNKIKILKESRSRVIVSDTSKLGITLEHKFADFHDDVVLVVNNDPMNKYLAELMMAYPTKVRLA
jgi:DeoR/GlpR family transcriptional regulator of sugar metabolism